MRRDRHRDAARALALLAATLVSTGAVAGSEESTAELLILPLAIEGRERTSEVTLSNGSNTPITVRSTWFGAVDTPLALDRAGPLDCDPVSIMPLGAVSLPLRDLCPRLRTPDVENRGYMRVWVESDQRAYIGAAIVTTTAAGAQFRIDAEPLGAHDIAAPIARFLQDSPGDPFRNLDPLQVHGLEGEVAPRGGPRDLVARCWVAAPDRGKAVDLVVQDDQGQSVGRPVPVVLGDGEMREVQVFDLAGLPPGTYRQMRVLVTTPITGATALDFERAPIVAGCGSERMVAEQVDYRRARTPSPSDATRQPIIDADIGVTSGPYKVGMPLSHVLWGHSTSTKAVVAVFVQPEDQIACRAVIRNPRFAPLQYQLELQVKDAAGTVVAGGDGIRETGLFETGPRDRAGGALDGPWTIEVSLDEAAYSANPPPGGARIVIGDWGLMCESAAGLSQPVLQSAGPLPSPSFLDDF